MKYIHQIITTLHRYIVLIETIREEQAHRVFTGDEFIRIALKHDVGYYFGHCLSSVIYYCDST